MLWWGQNKTSVIAMPLPLAMQLSWRMRLAGLFPGHDWLGEGSCLKKDCQPGVGSQNSAEQLMCSVLCYCRAVFSEDARKEINVVKAQDVHEESQDCPFALTCKRITVLRSLGRAWSWLTDMSWCENECSLTAKQQKHLWRGWAVRKERPL